MKENAYSKTMIRLFVIAILIVTCIIADNYIVFADASDNKFDGVDSVQCISRGNVYVIKDVQNDGGGTLWCVQSSTYAKNMGIDNVVKAYADSSSYIVVLKTDGTVWTYGNDNNGRRGVGGTEDLSWAQVYFGEKKDVTVVDIEYANEKVAALLSDGSLWMWGTNKYGQLGLGDEFTDDSYSKPQKVVFQDDNLKIRKISLGSEHCAAIDENDKLYIWGSNYSGQISLAANGMNDFIKFINSPAEVKIKGVSSFIDVSLGSYFTAVIADSDGDFDTDTDRSMYTWGNNDHGQLGVGDSTYEKNVPIKNKYIEDIKTIYMWANYGSATDKDGRLYMWGDAYSGRFGYDESGDLITSDRSVPTEVIDFGVDLSDAKDYKLDDSIKCIVFNDGTISIWGTSDAAWNERWDENYHAGDLFGETEEPKTTITTLNDITNVKDLSLGDRYSATLQENGTIWTWGRGVSALGRNLKKWEYKNNDEYGYYAQPYFDQPDTIELPTHMKGDVKSIVTSNYRTAIVSTEGELWFVNNNGYSDKCFMENVNKVSLGDYHSAVIDNDGHLWTWGENDYGQLGNGTNTYSNDPVQVLPEKEFTSVSLGYKTSAAVTTEGELYVWGTNQGGLFGNGTYEGSSSVPILVESAKIDYENDPVRSVCLSNTNSSASCRIIALTDMGLLIWGKCYSGGDGFGSYSTPQFLSTQYDIREVSANEKGFAVISEDNKLYLWGGFNQSDGKTVYYTPEDHKLTLIKSIADSDGNDVNIEGKVRHVSLGSDHYGIIKTDGTVLLWGSDDYGQLGDGFRGLGSAEDPWYSHLKVTVEFDESEFPYNYKDSIYISLSGNQNYKQYYSGDTILLDEQIKSGTYKLELGSSWASVSVSITHAEGDSSSTSLSYGDNIYVPKDDDAEIKIKVKRRATKRFRIRANSFDGIELTDAEKKKIKYTLTLPEDFGTRTKSLYEFENGYWYPEIINGQPGVVPTGTYIITQSDADISNFNRTTSFTGYYNACYVIDKDSCRYTSYYDYDEGVTVNNSYTPVESGQDSTGNLKVDVDFDDNCPLDSDEKNAVSYTVTGPEGFEEQTKTFGELTDGVWDLGEVPAGTYAVTQDNEAANKEGYIRSTDYSLFVGDATEGTSLSEPVAFDVVGDTVSTLKITNSYKTESKTGTLKVKAAFDDVLSNDEKNKVEFSVSGPEGFSVDPKKFSAFKDGVWDLGEVPVGTYTVTETGVDKEKYILKRQYRCNGVSMDEPEGVVEKGKETEINIDHTYEKDITADAKSIGVNETAVISDYADENDILFKFTPSVSGRYLFESFGSETADPDCDVLVVNDNSFTSIAFDNSDGGNYMFAAYFDGIAGQDYYLRIHNWNYADEYSVRLTKSDVEGVSFTPKTPYVVNQYENGHWIDIDGDGWYFEYDAPEFEEGDILTVTKTSGPVIYVYDDEKKAFACESDEIPESKIRKVAGTWQPEQENKVTLWYAGSRAQVPVALKGTEIKSVSLQPSGKYTYTENDPDSGWLEDEGTDDEYFRYKTPGLRSGDIFTLTTTDGTKQYVFDSDKRRFLSETGYIDLGDDDSDYLMTIYDDQDKKHWTIGSDNTLYFRFGKFKGTVTEPVTIVEKTPVEDKGSLKIVATFDSVPTAEDRNKISFTVTGPNGYNEEKSYIEFTNGVYEFNDLVAGDYFITETGAEIENYNLTTTFMVGEKKTNKATVTKDNTVTITVDHQYEEIEKGSLKIQATFDSSFTDEEKNSVTFTVSGPEGFKPLTKRVSDFVNGIWELKDLKAGAYTVSETSPERENYTLEKKYMYNGVDTNEPVVEVKGNSTSVLSVSHGYTFDRIAIKSEDVKLLTSKYAYNGKNIKPVPKVTVGSIQLKKGKDYTVKYNKKCKEIGKYKLTVTGIGRYKNTVVKKYTVFLAPLKYKLKITTDKGFTALEITPKNLKPTKMNKKTGVYYELTIYKDKALKKKWHKPLKIWKNSFNDKKKFVIRSERKYRFYKSKKYYIKVYVKKKYIVKKGKKTIIKTKKSRASKIRSFKGKDKL